MRVLFDSRPARTCVTGIGRYAETLARVAGGALGDHELLDGRAVLSFASPLEEELELPALFEREGLDVLHTPLFALPAVLPGKAIVTIHDAIPALRPELCTTAFAAVWAHAADAASRADAVVCPSDAARRDVARALNLPLDRVHIVPETPSPSFQPPEAHARESTRRRHGLGEEPFVLVLGALERRKNPTLVLDALQANPDLPRAVFVGPPGAIDLRAEAERRGVRSRVLYLDVLPDEELVALLGAATALVFSTLAEGFGLPVIEAFATGTPVVASAIPAVAEVAGDGALLVAPGDAQALALAVRRVAKEPELADALRARGRARLERYSPAALRSALERVYDHLAGAQPPGARP